MEDTKSGTYSYIYLSLDASNFNTEEVTKILGVEPTDVKLKSSPVPVRTSWQYKVYSNKDLDIAIRFLNSTDTYVDVDLYSLNEI